MAKNNNEKLDELNSKKDDNFAKIDGLEKEIGDKLHKNINAKDTEQLEKRITEFKPYLKNLGNNGNNNNIVEFLTKVIFDKNSVSAKGALNKGKSDKTVHDMLTKENWGKVFSVEQERMDRYGEYEIIYSYIPELASCIDSFRDSIISPDSLINDALPIKLTDGIVSDEAQNIFDNNKKALDKKYKLSALQKQIIGDTLKFGDQFVAVLRYEDEFKKLLNESNEAITLPPEFLDVSLRTETSEFLVESFTHAPIFEELKSCILKESFNGKKEKENELNNYYDSVVKDVSSILDKVKVKNAKEFGQENKGIGVDSKRIDFSKLDLKGCLVKKLDPKYMVKLEIDGINLGYLFAQKQEKQTNMNATATLNKDFFSARTNTTQDVNGKTKEEILFNIIGKGIAKKIDLDFIEENKEYKDLIYLLLNNEELLKGEISFVYFSPEEVVHFFIDKDGVYGTSRLAKSLFFAKLYIPSILNEFMQKITRGRDKRVVYVDVGVDEAVEESIQEVVRDIKSKEIQTDNLQSLTTILKSVGNFEDYYIPLWDGEKSIEFDTIAGMDVQSDREWNEFLLKSVIKGTGFPANYVDSSNEVDFARTVIMQNQLLVRKIVSDQEAFQDPMTELVKRIYQFEFEKNEEASKKSGDKENFNITEEIVNSIVVHYTPPVTLNLNNINDQINNATQTLDFIMNSYFPEASDDDDETKTKKLKFKRKASEKLIPSIDFDEFDKMFDEIDMETKEEILLKKTIVTTEDDGDDYGTDDYGGDTSGDAPAADPNATVPDPNAVAPVDNGAAPAVDPNAAVPDPNAAAPSAGADGQPMTGVDDMSNTGL